MSYIAPPSSGGSVAGANYVQAEVNFVNPQGSEDTTTSVTVTGQTWVTGSSIIICSVAGIATSDHPDSEEAAVEDIAAYVRNLVPGVGFDIVAYAPRGTWGRYWINAVGM